MRLFIAIDVPDSWKKQMAEVQAAIGWLGHGVKWVDPASTHLTLRFLGETDERDLDIVREAMNRACDGIHPFPLQMRGTGVFPTSNKPSVYWAGLKHDSALIQLQENIERRMVDLDYEPEEHPFRPHLTLARIRESIGKKRMTDALLSYKLEADPITVSEILLVWSQLGKETSQYKTVGVAKLASHI